MNFKDKIPAAVRRIAEHIEVRVAGGAVRDLLLGNVPKDFDLATPVVPTEVIRLAHKAGFKVIPTGLQHGTITILVDGEGFEVTTLRIDTNHDGRHADVQYTDSWREDAARRDFTINSLFLTMDGEVIDYFNGQDDIKSRFVRFVGDPDDRMQEDYLRILRMYRFCGRLGMNSSPEYNVYAVRRNAHGLQKISGERIWVEMQGVLSSDIAPMLLRAMQDADVLYHTSMPLKLAYDTMERVGKLTENPITRLMAVMMDRGSTDKVMKTLKERWKVSSAELRLAKFLSDNRADHPIPKGPYLYKLLIGEDGASIENARELAALHEDEDALKFLDGWVPPVFPINGNDLKKLGMKPGPDLGEVLERLRSAWSSSDFEMDRDQLLEHAKSEVADYQ